MKRFSIFLLFTLISLSVFSQNIPNFRSPLDIPLILSGNFGELRSDHFHSGIDIKTQGLTGKSVYAVDSGYVSRIKVEPGGYGKALYINHPGGYTSVYGHLSSYNKQIDAYVKKIQYRRESHSVDIYLKPGEILVKKGELIALSGNSGSSAGPHLHFEIRRSSDQHPLNALLYNLDVKDVIRPKIKRLAIYPTGDDAQVNSSFSTYILDVNSDTGSPLPGNNRPIIVHGKIGFGIETYDYLNGASNRCGIYSLELLVDGKRAFYSEMDEFSFDESRFINAHIDYSLKADKNYNIQRLYKQPYNRLSIYKDIKNDGITDIRDTLTHAIRILVKDSYGNTTQIAFDIKGAGSNQQIALRPEQGNVILPFNAASEFSEKDISISFPAYCFYDDVDFKFARTSGGKDLLSDIFYIHNNGTAVHKRFQTEITPEWIPAGKEDKLCLVKIENNNISYVGGRYENGKVSAQLRSFGNYAVAIDTIIPVIKPLNLHPGKDVSKQPGIRFTIKDELSGINEYNGYIDNQWVLFEYDPKNDLLSYEFDSKVPISKKNHELEIYLIDGAGNAALFHTVFYR